MEVTGDCHVQDERTGSSSLKQADQAPAAGQRFDRGALLLLRALYLAIVAPLFILTLCFWLPAWCWRVSRTHRKH